MAINYFERAKKIRIAELGEKHPQVGSIYNNIGLAYKTKGEYENALLNFNKSVEIKLLSANNSVFLNYINLGELYHQMGNYSFALNYFEKADEILKDLNIPEKQGDVYLNMGGALIMLDAYREAYEYFQKALYIYLAVYGEEHEKVGEAYQNLATVYDALNDVENVEFAFNKSVAIYEKIEGAGDKIADLYNNLGVFYQRNGRYSESLIYLEKASDIYNDGNIEHSLDYLSTLSNIAVSHQLMGNYDEAINYFHETIENLDQQFQGDHPFLAYSYNKLAEIYLEKEDTKKALSFVQAALHSNLIQVNNIFIRKEKCLDPGYLFDSYLILGRIYTSGENQTENNYKEGLNYFYIADPILSAQRNFFFNKEDKIDLAKKSKLLAGAVLRSLVKYKSELDLQELEIAFYYIEKSKNLVLLQSISENQGKSFAGIPDSLLLKEGKILGQINRLTHQIKIESDSLKRIQLEEKLFQQKQEYKLLVENLEKNYPDYFDLKYNEELPDIEEVQSNLNPKRLC